MKLCKDCDLAISGSYYFTCKRVVPEHDLVEGARYKTVYAWCSSERSDYCTERKWTPCGPDGKYWKPRRPWWKRLLGVK